MKIYTKTGDCGTTGLFAGPRVDKDHPRIEAYGAVDELSAVLGVVVATLTRVETQRLDRAAAANLEPIAELLSQVQSDLFSIGAELATPDPLANNMCLLTADRVEHLEQWIDQTDAQLTRLQSFILPGGSQGSAMLHLARTVCRRAERDVVRLSHNEEVSDCRLLLIYLNRLSDLLFVLARRVNAAANVPDMPWRRPS